MIAAIGVVFGLAYLDLRREQSRALDDFSVEQHELARATAATLQSRIDAVLHLLQAAARARDPDAIGDIVTRDRYIVAAGVVDPDGDAGATPIPGAARLDAHALRLARPGLDAALREHEIAISDPVLDANGLDLRLFATRAGARDLVLAVDRERLLEGLAPDLGADTLGRIVVRDTAGLWTSFGASDAGTAAPRWSALDAASPLGVHDLLRAMADTEHGVAVLDQDAAGSLGLEPRLAIAGFATVRVTSSRAWSVAVVSSAMRVRDRARAGAWRLGAATALAGSIVAAFGVIVRRQERRAMALAEALRTAEATAALRERSETIVESIPVGVLTLDAASRVASSNRYLADRGLAAGGSLESTFAAATPDERAMLVELVAAARRVDVPVVRNDVTLHFTPDTVSDVDLFAVRLRRGLPDADCFVLIHDRTEIRRLERGLARADRLALVGTLAAGVAHELGTPLGIISGRAEQLLARTEESDASRKALTTILAQVDKVSTTIRQLLDFARVRPIDAAELSPRQILSSAAALLDHRFRQSSVALDVEASDTLPMVSGDAGQLEQVFVNLLLNAVDACDRGGHVRLSAAAEQGAVVFEVADDGCGILGEHLGSVLDPFFTTKKRGQGTGLGLSIAADIVKNHGGSIRIDSAVGRGTRVEVRLPTDGEPACKRAS
jgi:two-component system sensor histidine kinase HydH